MTRQVLTQTTWSAEKCEEPVVSMSTILGPGSNSKLTDNTASKPSRTSHSWSDNLQRKSSGILVLKYQLMAYIKRSLVFTVPYKYKTNLLVGVPEDATASYRLSPTLF